MTARKFLFLETGLEGTAEEENPVTDSATLGQLTLGGLSGVGLFLSNTLISQVATPVSSTDAATKAYVDSASSQVKQILVDCGSLPVAETTALFTDTSVTVTSKLVACLSGQTPPGKDADEIGMDSLLIVASPLAGQVQIYMRGLEGYIHDKFYVCYTVGA